MCVHRCPVVSDSVIPWTVGLQVPLSIRFSRQEYWNGLPFPSPGDLPHSGIKHKSLVSPAVTDKFFTTGPPGKPCDTITLWDMVKRRK